MRRIVGSIEAEYGRYKALAEGAMEQLTDGQLCRAGVEDAGGVGANSIATIVWHMSGNFASRFTDFLRADGEKPWRDRDSEFLQRTVTRAELLEKWGKGWSVMFEALAGLNDEQLQEVVKIRGVPHSVVEALHRSLAHAAYHVGQIVFLAKELRGGEWRYLSIPPGESAAFNENRVREKPSRGNHGTIGNKQ